MSGSDVDVSLMFREPAIDRGREDSGLAAWDVDQDVKVFLRAGLFLSDENAEKPASVIARPNSQLVPGSINQLGVIERREGA